MTTTMTRIPLVDVVAQNREVADGLRREIAEVFQTGAFVGGPAVTAFQDAYARHAERAHCIGVSSGTEALRLALGAVGVGRGDEVVVPAETFVATAEAVMQLGAVPVVVDTDPVFHLIDPDRVAERIGPRTRAVVPVHLFGQMAPMDALNELAGRNGLVVVEDAAQAHGASRFGRRPGHGTAAAATSFYPGKNLGACGDAGAVLTDRPDIARSVEAARDHASVGCVGGAGLVGGNARLDAVQAAVLHVKLTRLDAWNAARAEVAGRYTGLLEGVADVETPRVLDGNVHAWHLYPVSVPAEMRDRLLEWMRQGGIECGVHYRTPVHLHPNLRFLGRGSGECPVAEAATPRLLSLPMHPHLRRADVERVVERLVEGLERG